MNTEKLNVWLSLGANIGVLVGIFVLIIQINQTNTMMAAQAAQARADSAINIAIARISAPGFAEIITTEDRESLSRADQYRLDDHQFLIWRQMENLHYQVEIGVLDAQQARLKQVARAVLSSGIQPDWWEKQQPQRDDNIELREYLDAVYQEMKVERGRSQ